MASSGGSESSTSRCIASYRPSTASDSIRRRQEGFPDLCGFKNAVWSPDGTSIIGITQKNELNTFVLPPDLLSQEALRLDPYAAFRGPEPLVASAAHPGFALDEPTTTLCLISIRDHPTRLVNALAPESPLGRYPLINTHTEAYQTPHSLLYTASGTHFLAGSDSLIAAFDLSRDGDGPVERWPTVPSRRKTIVGGGVGMKGIVSAMHISVDHVLAAATLSRSIALYAAEGRGERVAVWGLARDQSFDGHGVTDLRWDDSGRYLYVSERKSDEVNVFDIRVTGTRVARLIGRQAQTNQRLGTNLSSVKQGAASELWAGGDDGQVRSWMDPTKSEGDVLPTTTWAAHSDPVVTASPHTSGSVIMTCSGEDYSRSFERGVAVECDPSLKIWTLPQNRENE